MLSAIKHLQVPVIVVPPAANFKSVKKLALACDFRDVIMTTPEKEIRAIVQVFGAELYVLNVGKNNQHFTADTPEQSFLLHNMIADLKLNYHWIVNEGVEDGLNDFIEQNKIDGLIVIPKKHSFLEALFHKSHSKALAFESKIPVLSINEW
jgi:hypothetical protein